MSYSSIGLPSSNFDFEVCKLKLGSGGSGLVFLAQHRKTKELVAVKRLFWSPAVDTPGAPLPQHRPSSEPRTPKRERVSFPVSSLSLNEGNEMYSSRNYSQDYNDAHHQTYNTMEEVGQGDQLSNVALTSAPRPVRPPCESTILQFLGPHQHIVKFLGNYTSPNRVTYLAMELMDSDLGREIRASNTFMDEDVIRCLLHGVVSAIDHLHKRGVAHCDIKPSNVLLKRVPAPMTSDAGSGSFSTATFPPKGCESPSGQPKSEYVQAFLGDFSAAHFTHEGERRSRVHGTLYYKSPEQLMGHSEDLFACDMWALGCTIFELITGSVAFCGSSDLEVLHQIYAKLGTDFYNFPSRVRQSTLFDSLRSPSPALLHLLKSLLALDPRERFSAKELLQQAFFKPLQHVLDREQMGLTFPLQLRCGKPVDASQFTFHPIVTTPTIKRSKDVVGDANVSFSAHHCSIWSLSSMSAAQSPATQRHSNKHTYEDVSRRRCSLFSLSGARGHGGSMYGKDETPSTVRQAIVAEDFSCSPFASVKHHGVNGVTKVSCGKQPQLQSTSGITLGNLRTNMIFDRSCGAFHEQRELFRDESESPNWVVRKTLFESPGPLKCSHVNDSVEKVLREQLEHEAMDSKCCTPRAALPTHDSVVPLRELFRLLPENAHVPVENSPKTFFKTDEWKHVRGE